MSDYSGRDFFNDNGTFDKTTCPIRNTKAVSYALTAKFDGKIVQIEHATLYPPEFFWPLSSDSKRMQKTEKVFAVHWLSDLWLSEEEMIVHEWRFFRKM